MRYAVIVLAAAVAVAAFAGCAKKTVTRIDEGSTIDLSGRWNDTDSRLVSEEMIRDCLSKPWKAQAWEARKRKPIVIVGRVRNKSSEHIATGTFIGDIERAFVNTGEAEVVASKDEREDVRDERADQQSNASDETMKKWGRERGADYMLSGEINSITDEEKGERVVFYQIDMTLIDLETNAKAWIGQKKIKKYVGKNRVKP
jgi:hypothetical protein